MATVHGDDITICGQRTAVEFFIKMIPKKYEIRDNKYSGKTQTWRKAGEYSTVSLNETATASQLRQIRGIEGLELERANHSATPCAVERRDESKGENRCGRGQTKRRWDDVNDDDNRERPRMADDDAIDSQALTGG